MPDRKKRCPQPNWGPHHEHEGAQRGWRAASNGAGAWLSTLVFFLATGCREKTPLDLCLRENLGQYLFESADVADAGCIARYHDSQGNRAEARVMPGQRQPFPDGGVPVPFEKHLVVPRPESGGLRLGWVHGDVGVEVFLAGAHEPQGPVLRAYLMGYPSEVLTEVEATQRDIEQLRQSSHETPKNAAVHLSLARNYLKLGNTIMAAQEYQISISVDPQCFECYLGLGTLYRDLRHWDLSIRALRKAVGLRPTDASASVALGDVSFEVHNRDEAMKAYRAAIDAGLTGAERERVVERLKDLEEGKFMIEELPGARKP